MHTIRISFWYSNQSQTVAHRYDVAFGSPDTKLRRSIASVASLAERREVQWHEQLYGVRRGWLQRVLDQKSARCTQAKLKKAQKALRQHIARIMRDGSPASIDIVDDGHGVSKQYACHVLDRLIKTMAGAATVNVSVPDMRVFTQC